MKPGQTQRGGSELDSNGRGLRRQGKSFNEMVRELLRKESGSDLGEALERFFETADQMGARSADGKPLSREEVHDRGA